MNLQETKEKIIIVSKDPANNEKIKGWIMLEDDCFGRGYENDAQHCKNCQVMADVDGRKEMISVFCLELCQPDVVIEETDEGISPKSEKEKAVDTLLDVAGPEIKKNLKKKEGGNMEETAQKRVTAMSLVVEVLKEAWEPLDAKAITERIIAKGWKTKGKTPSATVYVNLLRESKKPESLFVKSEDGKFGLK